MLKYVHLDGGFMTVCRHNAKVTEPGCLAFCPDWLLSQQTGASSVKKGWIPLLSLLVRFPLYNFLQPTSCRCHWTNNIAMSTLGRWLSLNVWVAGLFIRIHLALHYMPALCI